MSTTEEYDYYQKLMADIESGQVQPKPETLETNPSQGREAILAATGATSFDEAVEIAVGRPRLGESTGPSPSVRARVPQALKDRLDAYAQAHDRKPSEVMREALSAYLDKVA